MYKENVRYLLDNYGEHINNDKKLILLYWQLIDNVEMDKETISTVDYLNLATNPTYIIDAKEMLNIMAKEGIE